MQLFKLNLCLFGATNFVDKNSNIENCAMIKQQKIENRNLQLQKRLFLMIDCCLVQSSALLQTSSEFCLRFGCLLVACLRVDNWLAFAAKLCARQSKEQ